MLYLKDTLSDKQKVTLKHRHNSEQKFQIMFLQIMY